jgi:hypothetical protein
MSTPRQIVRRAGGVCSLALAVTTIAASVASAQTFYVNQRNGSDANQCIEPSAPCATIAGGIKRSEETAGPNTLELSAEVGPYEEPVALSNAADKDLTIHGEEAGVEIQSKTNATVAVTATAGAATLSNLRVEYRDGAKPAIADTGAALTLDDVAVESELSSAGSVIEASAFGSLAINGGSVVSATGPEGAAILAVEAPVALNGTTVTTEGLSESSGIESRRSGLSLVNSAVIIENAEKNTEEDFAVKALEDGSVTLTNLSVVQEGEGAGIVLEGSPTTANGVRVSMKDELSQQSGIATGLNSAGESSSFAYLNIEGDGTGFAFTSVGSENVTLSDSRLIESNEGSALGYGGTGEGQGLLVRRSLLQAGAKAMHGSLYVIGGNATVDSSEILGGTDGVTFENAHGGTRTLTLASSTVDAGVAGIANDAAGVLGVDAVATGTHASTTNVAIEGSIVLERQAAKATAGNQANVSCTYTATPNQSQAAKGEEGAIGCASGSAGNTNSSEEIASLFSEPFTSYQLSPSSSAIDSVPASAISLPFGLTPSNVDLVGNPRSTERKGNCAAVQDKGALELPQHAIACLAPPPLIACATSASTTASPACPPLPGPAAPRITALKLSPRSFFAAPSGATTSRAKKAFGTTIAYNDSQSAITTFTVFAPAGGRTQGKACRKPSRANRHGKHCTILKKLGTFTHADKPGANKLHFSGRLSGKRLAKGSYRLQAVPGNGVAVSTGFKIKG